MIRVLVVDDSEVTRSLLTHIINSDPELEVVGTAADGEEAVTLVERLKPDVVTMDLVMPRMDGFEATRRIMQTMPLPIVVVSASYSADEVSQSFRAMDFGALIMVDKPTGPGDPHFGRKSKELTKMVKAMSEVKVVRRRYPIPTKTKVEAAPPLLDEPVQVVGIGASTGGPQTLVAILGALPKTFSLPLLVVQHITPGFARGLTDWLRSATNLDVCLASNDEPLVPGRCFIAPTGFHMGLNREHKIFLSTAPPEHSLRPAVDFLFATLADVMGRHAAGLLLTGMGRDGAAGLLAMREKGAVTVVQDENSAIIASMPRTAIQTGAAKHILVPERIAEKLLELDELSRRSNRRA